MNPMMLLMNAARSGGDPSALLMQMAGSNPQAAQVLRLMQGKSPDQLRQTAENMARERGTSIEAVAQSLGLPKIS
nr:MAG TPA: Protein of unknown function (DUF2802) [Caudoviricetes sp.]